MIEIAPFFGGELRTVREFVRMMGADGSAPWMEADTEAAAEAWTRHVRLKRRGEATKRPLADVLIGAFAQRFAGLVTRNGEHLKSLFPRLRLRAPSPQPVHSTA
jgi:hypothetical protein